MSWMNKTYKSISREYHTAREQAEGFSKPFVQPTPTYQLIKTLACYPLRGEDFFYMDLRKYAELLLVATKQVAETGSWDQVYNFAIAMRRIGLIKDPPIISAQIWPNKSRIADLLATYPANKMLLYAELARTFDMQYSWGWGRRKKEAIATALATQPLRWHELQAIKHRHAFRDLIRMVHPRPPSQEISGIWRWAIKGGDAPTDKIDVYMRILKMQDADKAVRTAVDADLPWEVVRSRIGRLDALPPELLVEAAMKIMTPFDIAAQALSIVKRAGQEALSHVLASRRVPLSAGSRAALELYARGYRDAAVLFFERVKMGRSEFAELLPAAPRRIIALVDISASMYGNPIRSAISSIMPLIDVIDSMYLFNEGVSAYEGFRSLNGLMNLASMTRGGTALYDSMFYVANAERMTDDDVLLVFTDEQENASRLASMADVVSLKTRAVLMVVAPYPADMILKQDNTRAVAYPGSDPDAVLASMRLITSATVIESEGAVDLIRLLPPAARKNL